MENALAAFIAGLSQDYYGHVQAASPKDVEDAYRFVCQLQTKKATANYTTNRVQAKNETATQKDSISDTTNTHTQVAKRGIVKTTKQEPPNPWMLSLLEAN